MTVDPETLVFFDASCLIAAAGRPTGGSGWVLSLCARRLLVAVVSQPVLLEAEANVRAKLGDHALNVYHRLLEATPMIVALVPQLGERDDLREIVSAKDAHVLAAAANVDAAYLLTLDKRLAQTVNAALPRPQAMSPGEFITSVLPSHPDAGRLRTD